MRNLALIIFSFFAVLSSLIYFTKNYQYQKYVLLEKETNKKAYLINLNLAQWHDFASLPGISDNLAKEIIRFRKEKGRFDDIHEIMQVKGIGKKKFERIKSYISLEV